jgi:hypothetical protein
MSASSAIATIRATISRKLITHEMFAACPAMAAFAKNFYEVYKICSFHRCKGREVFLGIIFKLILILSRRNAYQCFVTPFPETI